VKIYVAGNFQHDRHTVAIIASVLEGEGHEITFKWWEEFRHTKAEKAGLDMGGVARADVLVVYMENSRRYQGTWVEVGIALQLGSHVYFIGDWGESCIFRHHNSCSDFFQEFPDRDSVEAVKEALA